MFEITTVADPPKSTSAGLIRRSSLEIAKEEEKVRSSNKRKIKKTRDSFWKKNVLTFPS